ALDTLRKHILIDDNHRYLKTYNYAGEFISKRDLQLFYRDLEMYKEGEFVFASAKLINYDGSKQQGYELWILDQSGGFGKFFPFDLNIFPNGSEHSDMYRMFCNFQDKLYFNYPLNDTIYQILPDC